MPKIKEIDSFQNTRFNSQLPDEREIHFKHIATIFVAVSVLSFSLYFFLSDSNADAVPTCGDGTFYNTCSLDKPYFCDNGVLTEKASVCSCSKFLPFKKEGELCTLSYQTDFQDIKLNYILNGDKGIIDFRIYKGVYDYVTKTPRTIQYQDSETPSRADFKVNSLNNEIQNEMLLPLVKRIENLAPSDKAEQARIAVSIVQNIPYGFSNKTLFFAGQEVNYSRYPYEVVYEGFGICGEKSELMAYLLKELGYGVSIFYFADENHEAVGIKCPVENSFYGTGYCFVETGGPSIITDSSMEFEGRIRLDSKPEVLIVSEGISLPEDMYEYRDSKTFSDIRERNIFGILKAWKYKSLKEKYGLDGVYSLG